MEQLKKSDLTGATASLRPDANDASKAVSIDGLLQGKIAGLNVTASMSTGAAFFCYYLVLIHYVEIISHYVIDNVPQASTGESAGVQLWEVVTSR